MLWGRPTRGGGGVRAGGGRGEGREGPPVAQQQPGHHSYGGMGNQLAVPPPHHLLGGFPAADLATARPHPRSLVHKAPLGGGRLLKTFQCLDESGRLLVAKVYAKEPPGRGGAPPGPLPALLAAHERRLGDIAERLAGLDSSHVLVYDQVAQTERAAYLLRQYTFSNLWDRISTRPFLTLTEKRWVAFQVLHALQQVHERGVCHGDVKCENVLVTSWNWVYLSDFAPFKPVYLPADDPSDFSFFFENEASRRRCYVAPERFYEAGKAAEAGAGPGAGAGAAELTPAMDIFSAGCVLAELFLEGRQLFDLSQLHAYRRGEYDPGPVLAKVPDPQVRALIQDMIQLDPARRNSAAGYLEAHGAALFPPYFTQTLHQFFSSLLPLGIDSKVRRRAACVCDPAAATDAGDATTALSHTPSPFSREARRAGRRLPPDAGPHRGLPHPRRPGPGAADARGDAQPGAEGQGGRGRRRGLAVVAAGGGAPRRRRLDPADRGCGPAAGGAAAAAGGRLPRPAGPAGEPEGEGGGGAGGGRLPGRSARGGTGGRRRAVGRRRGRCRPRRAAAPHCMPPR